MKNERKYGNCGVILEIDLSSRTVKKTPLKDDDIISFIGGRGLGMKLLWDRIKTPGLNPLSPENPLIFAPGLFSGFPIPSSSRTCIVTKSPVTSPVRSSYRYSSTVTFTNIGGFFGPEIKFAGYDAIVITGKASFPVYIVIDNGRVEIRDASKFKGMGTDEFDRAFTEELGDRNYKTCYIGPAGENLVKHACILHTSARAAGRGGAGCVMGSKSLKAIAVKGSNMPLVSDPVEFMEEINDARGYFNGLSMGRFLKRIFRKKGTAFLIEKNNDKGKLVAKNYREGFFEHADKIGYKASEETVWLRSSACYCCPLSCKKNGTVKKGRFKGIVHDGPEYETGTMFGSNLLVSDLKGLLKAIFDTDDLGMDIITTGNIIGFLMEAYEKKLIDIDFLDGIDLKWGDIDAVRKMIKKISDKEGVGETASGGVKYLSELIGKESEKFAIHSKGMELAAWNVHADSPKTICYATSNRGACHQNGGNVKEQNFRALIDSLCICRFATDVGKTFRPGLGVETFSDLLRTITGKEWSQENLLKAGERIYNLEKLFNVREGFRRIDDSLPDRFFEEPLTKGPEKGAVIKRNEFEKELDRFYMERGWDPATSNPGPEKIQSLGLGGYV